MKSIRIKNNVLLDMFRKLSKSKEFSACIEYDPFDKKYKIEQEMEGGIEETSFNICQYITIHTHPITSTEHINDYVSWTRYRALPLSVADFVHSLAAIQEELWYTKQHLTKTHDVTIGPLLFESLFKVRPIYYNVVIAPEGIYAIYPKIPTNKEVIQEEIVEELLRSVFNWDDVEFGYMCLKIYDKFLEGKYKRVTLQKLSTLSRDYADHFEEFLISQKLVEYYLSDERKIALEDWISEWDLHGIESFDEEIVQKFTEDTINDNSPRITIDDELFGYALNVKYNKAQSLFDLLSRKISKNNFQEIWIVLMNLFGFYSTFLSSDDILNNHRDLLL